MATTYSPPPDFQSRTDQINNAYTTALAKTKLQRSQLYTTAGFKDGTTQLDPSQRFGGIQQLLHQEGQALTSDDQAETHRGLGLDSGLGAQAQGDIRYQEHLGVDSLGKTLLSGVAQLGDADTQALQQKNSDSLSNSNDEAEYNAGQNAYNDALANYLKQMAGSTAATGGPQAGIGSSIGSYLPTSTVAAAAAKSTKSVVGKTGNSGIHAQ